MIAQIIKVFFLISNGKNNSFFEIQFNITRNTQNEIVKIPHEIQL